MNTNMNVSNQDSSIAVLKGKFIVIEGPDRVGKSTLINNVYNQLVDSSIPVIKMGFPDRTSVIGSFIGSILEDDDNKHVNINAMNTLFLAEMINAQSLIEEKLKEGYVVLCDRYYFSTYMYTIARCRLYLHPNEEDEATSLVDDLAEYMRIPDIVCVMIAEPEELAKREGYGSDNTETLAFQKEVIKSYETNIHFIRKYSNSVFYMNTRNYETPDLLAQSFVSQSIRQVTNLAKSPLLTRVMRVLADPKEEIMKL